MILKLCNELATQLTDDNGDVCAFGDSGPALKVIGVHWVYGVHLICLREDFNDAFLWFKDGEAVVYDGKAYGDFLITTDDHLYPDAIHPVDQERSDV